MKKIASTALCSVLFLSTACGDDDGGTNNGDADAGPAVDAGPVDTPDAMPASSGACGMVIDPNSSILAVGLTPLAGVPVVFSNPDGSLIGVEYTDVKGMASRDDCVRGTTMTFFLENEGYEGAVYSYAGANPGDTFYFRAAPPYGGGPSEPYANINVTMSQDVSGLSGQWAWELLLGGCYEDDDEGVPDYSEFSLVSPCVFGPSGTTVDVLAWTYGADGGIDGINGYAFARDVPLTLGTDTTPADNTIALGPWIPGNLDNTARVINLPSTGLSDYGSFWGWQRGGGVYQEFSGGDYWGSDPSPPVISTTFMGLPDGFGARSGLFSYVEAYLPYGYYNGVELGQQSAFQRTVTGDYSDHLPTFVGAVSNGSTERPTVHWVTGVPAQGDVAVIKADLVPYQYNYPYYYTTWWYVVTPNVADGAFTLPELPEGLVDLFADPYYEALIEYGEIVDLDVLTYGDLVGTPGFEPSLVSPEYIPYLVPPAALPEELRLRGAFYYFEGDY